MISQMRVTFTLPARTGLCCPSQLSSLLKIKSRLCYQLSSLLQLGKKIGWTTKPNGVQIMAVRQESQGCLEMIIPYRVARFLIVLS